MIDWFRSHHGAPTDPKYILIAAKAGTEPGVVAAIWWSVLDHASQATPRGSVEGFDVEVIAAFYRWDFEVVDRVVSAFRERGMIAEDGTLSAWSKRQPKREREDPNAAERAKGWRERQRTPTNANERLEKSRGEEKRTPPLPPSGACPPPSVRASSGRAPKRATQLSESWKPNDGHARIASEEGVDLRREEAKFRDHAAATGRTLKDWDAGFRTWIRNAKSFDRNGKARDGPTDAPLTPSQYKRYREIRRELEDGGMDAEAAATEADQRARAKP